MADVILPACTNLERNDIFEIGNCGGFSHNAPVCNYRLIVYLKKSIKPLGESRADYDIFSAIAEKLGVKEYYRRLGYKDEGPYVSKILTK